MFIAGAAIGVLGGMIGLGGAEFRLPVLIGLFGFVALQAVILNKAMSLLVVITALPARLVAVPYPDLAPHWPVVVNLLCGSRVGRRVGRRDLGNPHALGHPVSGPGHALGLDSRRVGVDSCRRVGAVPLPHLGRAVAGIAIGVVAALMGVAGGELLIPTIVLLYGVNIKLAGSLSLAVSLPTMLVALARYSRDQSFQVLRVNTTFVAVMAIGSIAGTVLGGLLLDVVPDAVLIPVLVAVPDVRHQGLATRLTRSPQPALPHLTPAPRVRSRHR